MSSRCWRECGGIGGEKQLPQISSCRRFVCGYRRNNIVGREMSFSITQFGMRLPLLTVNTISLHGKIPGNYDFPPVYEKLKLVFAKMNRDVSAVDADSPDDPPDAGPQDFEQWQRRLSASGFPQNLICLTLTKYFPMTWQPILVGSFGSSGKGFLLSFDSLVCGFSGEFFESVGRTIWDVYPFDYGYALQLPRTMSAWAYGGGNIGDSKDYRSGNMTRYRRWRKYYTDRMGAGLGLGAPFRDIYPVNFLNKLHLETPLHGSTVEEWIAADSDRGTLSRFNDQIWAWHIPHGAVPVIRKRFIEAGLLISWNERA
jgi:hypothetical protein